MTEEIDYNEILNLEKFPYGLVLLDKKLCIVSVNYHFCSLIGYSKEEFMKGSTLNKLFLTDKPLELEIIANNTLVEPIYIETDLIAKNNEKIPVQMEIIPIISSEKIIPNQEIHRILMFRDSIQLTDAKTSGIESFSRYALQRVAITVYTLEKTGPTVFQSYNEGIFESYKELMIKFGIYIFTTIGQGLEHSTGLYGPLPVPNYNYLSIVYASELPDSKQGDLRELGKRYTIHAIFFPKYLEFIFNNRKRIQKTLQNRIKSVEDIHSLNTDHLRQILEDFVYIKELPKYETDLERKLLATYNIGRVVSRATDLNSAFNSIATFCEEILNFKILTFLLVNKMTNELEVIITRGYRSPESLVGLKIPINSKNSVVARVVRTRKAINIKNTQSVKFYLKVSKLNLKSELAVPIYGETQDEVLGVLNVESDIENGFNNDDELLFTIVAETASAVLQRYWKEIHLEAIHNLAESLAQIYDPREAFERIATFAEKTLNLKIFGALIVDENINELKFLSHRGYKWKKKKDIPKIPIDSNEFFVSHVVRLKKSLYIDNVQKQSGIPYFKVMEDVIAEYAIPLMDKDKVLGILNIESNRPFTRDERFLFDVLGHHATITLRLYKNMVPTTSSVIKKSNKESKRKKTIKKRRKSAEKN